MDALEWKMVVGQRRFTNGHLTVVVEQEVTDFIRSRNLEDDMAEDIHLWRLEMNGRILAMQILIIITYKL